MMRVIYQVTVELPNGDWTWRNWEAGSFHNACKMALDFATAKEGKLVSITKLVSDQLRTVERDHPLTQ